MLNLSLLLNMGSLKARALIGPHLQSVLGDFSPSTLRSCSPVIQGEQGFLKAGKGGSTQSEPQTEDGELAAGAGREPREQRRWQQNMLTRFPRLQIVFGETVTT